MRRNESTNDKEEEATTGTDFPDFCRAPHPRQDPREERRQGQGVVTTTTRRERARQPDYVCPLSAKMRQRQRQQTNCEFSLNGVLPEGACDDVFVGYPRQPLGDQRHIGIFD